MLRRGAAKNLRFEWRKIASPQRAMTSRLFSNSTSLEQTMPYIETFTPPNTPDPSGLYRLAAKAN